MLMRHILLPPLVVLGLATAASAQKMPASKIEDFAKSGACVDAQLEKIQDVSRVAAGIGYTFVLKGGARLTTNSATSSDSIDDPLVAFEEVIIYGSDPDTKKVLVAAHNRKLCGWTTPDVLLLDPAKKIDRDNYRDGPAPLIVSKTPFGERDKVNNLTLKIVLHNFRVQGNEGTPIFEAPGGAKQPASQKQFNIYEVFRIVPAQDPDTNRPTRFYLAGFTPEGGGTTGHRQLRGWVRESDFYPWSSRMTVIWEGSHEVSGFSELARLKSGGEATFKKEAGFNEAARSEINRRFPVLEQFPSEGSVRAGRRPGAAGDFETKIEWYHVAVPGEACEEVAPGGSGGRKCVSNETSDKDRKDIWEIIGKLSNVDIMFVIDNTTSMKPYLADVNNAVREFVKKHGTTGARGEGSIRIGAAVYGDYRGPTAQLDKVQFSIEVPLGNPETGSFDKLLKLETYGDEQRDKLEAPYAALINAARQRAWSESAAFRYIVHIADHGNREMGAKSPEGTSNLVEQISIDDVIAALRDNKVTYVPIAVRGDFNTTNPHSEHARKARLRQARDIQQKAPEYARELQLTYDESSPTLSESGQRDRILQAMEFGLNLSTATRERADLIILCKTAPSDPRCKARAAERPPADDPSGIIIARVLKELFPTEALNALNRKQTIAAYYFPPRSQDGKPTFTFWVALDKQTIEALFDISQTVCRTIDQRGAFKTLKKELMQTLETKTGETNFASPAEGIQKGLFVPASHLSTWMTKDWSQIERDIEEASPSDLDAYKKEFCKKKTQLQLVIENSRADDNAFVWNAKERGWEVPAARKKKFVWNYSSGDGLRFYYIPVDYLP